MDKDKLEKWFTVGAVLVALTCLIYTLWVMSSLPID